MQQIIFQQREHRLSAPSQHITNGLAQPRGPAAYMPRPTQRGTCVSTQPATRDPHVPCSQAHTYTAHTYTAQPTCSPALQTQKHVTSPLAQTSRSSSASPDPHLPALQATRSNAIRCRSTHLQPPAGSKRPIFQICAQFSTQSKNTIPATELSLPVLISSSRHGLEIHCFKIF